MSVDTVNLHASCFSCPTEGTLTVKVEDYTKYIKGAMVQDAFPYLTPEQREFYLISGMCGECFDSIFGEDDND